jgi:hypothetical protein
LYWPSPLLPTAVARITVAALFIAGPVAIPGVWLNSLEAQTYLTLITVLLLFVQLERLTAVRFWTGAASIATATLSGVYAGILAPLFVVRAFVQRTGRAVLYAAVATIGAAIQLAVVAHLHIQGQTSDTKLVFRGFGAIVRNVAAYHIVGFVFGPHVAARAHGASRGIAGFVALFLFATAVLAFIATLLVHTRDRRLPMLLLGALLLEELGINYGASNNSFGRFAVVPIGILILMLVYGTATATASARRLLGIGLCTVVLVFGFFSFWTYQPSHLRCRGCPDWSQQVAQWRTGRSDRLAIWPYPAWHISPIRAPTQQQ